MSLVPTSVLVTAPVLLPLTLDEAKLRAGLDWVAGDARDALMMNFIRAASSKVELDIGYALLTQVRDVYADPSLVVDLPDLSLPLQSVDSVKSGDGLTTYDPATYTVDFARGRLSFAALPSARVVIRLTSGWSSVAALPPLAVQLVGALVAHYATLGRDMAIVGTIIADVPHGYDDIVDKLVRVSLP